MVLASVADRTLVCLALGVCAARMLAAQPSTGVLSGVVLDVQGAAVSGATVTLDGPGGTAVQVNDAQGEFEFLSLAPGIYSLLIEADGFSTLEVPNLVVSPGRATDLELQLRAAGSDGVVLTSGGADLVEPRFTIGTTVGLGGPAGADALFQTLPQTSGQRIRLSCGEADDLLPIPPQGGSQYLARSLFPVPGGFGFGFDRVDGAGQSFIHFGTATSDCALRPQTHSRAGLDLDTLHFGDTPFPLGAGSFGGNDLLSFFARKTAGGGTEIRGLPFRFTPAGGFTFSPDFRLSNTVGGAFNFGPQAAVNPVVDRIQTAHTVCSQPDGGCLQLRTSQLDLATQAAVPNTSFQLQIQAPAEFLPFGTNVAIAPSGDGLLTFSIFDPASGKVRMGAWPITPNGQLGNSGVTNLFPSLPGSVIGDRFSIRPGADYWTIVGEHFSANAITPFATTLPLQGLPLPGPALPLGQASESFVDPLLRPDLDLRFTIKAGAQAAPAAAGGAFTQQLRLEQRCAPNPTTLCLGGGRFQVRATHATSPAAIGAGTGFTLSNDTGYFTFFNAANVELLVKVIEGCSLGGHYWVFAGGLTDVKTVVSVTDTTTGQMVTLVNPRSTPFKPYQNTAAFACGAQSRPAHERRRPLRSRTPEPAAAGDQAACVADATHLCLGGGRFEVGTAWTTDAGATGAGHAVALPAPGGGAPDTGYFWFFAEANVEMVVKVLAACGLNARYWVFAGGLTNVRVVTTVRDTKTGAVHTYTNPQNTPFQPVQDTSAFPTCP